LSLHRRGRRVGSTNSHCSSGSFRRPAIYYREDALRKTSFAENCGQNIYEVGSSKSLFSVKSRELIIGKVYYESISDFQLQFDLI
jgi:hypothetical protein